MCSKCSNRDKNLAIMITSVSVVTMIWEEAKGKVNALQFLNVVAVSESQKKSIRREVPHSYVRYCRNCQPLSISNFRLTVFCLRGGWQPQLRYTASYTASFFRTQMHHWLHHKTSHILVNVAINILRHSSHIEIFSFINNKSFIKHKSDYNREKKTITIMLHVTFIIQYSY